MFARIALLSAPYSTLTYALPDIFPEEFWQEGLRVAIPLGRGALRAGILMERLEHSDLPDDVTCKEVAWPLETVPLLSEEVRALARDLAIRQGLEPGCVFGHVLPQGLRQVDLRIRWLAADRDFSCTVKQVTKLEPGLRQALAVALCRGEARLVAPGRDAAGEELCVLRVDPPWPVRPQAARKREILDYLHERGQVSRRQLTRDLGAGSAPALRSLLQAGFVALRHAEADEPADELLPPAPRAFELNADQQRALEALRAALETERPASVLLFGVTGSGKTAVYLELIRHCMEQGRSVLLLAPEVALACKLRRDAACVLPHVPLFFYHGYQPPARREEIFRRLATRQEPCLVVGTRSALFLPVPQLGCVILDEEHDSSFKQDESLPYQAKELAGKAARPAGAGLGHAGHQDLPCGQSGADRSSSPAGEGRRAAFAAGGAGGYQWPGRGRAAGCPQRAGPARSAATRGAGRCPAQPARLRAPAVLPGLQGDRQLSALPHRPDLP